MAVTEASLAYGLVVLFFSSVLCSSAGVGGGSLNVPILYSIIGFDYDVAVVLSLCTLMGNYLLQVLVNLDKRHPFDPSVPLIYWDAVLIMLPSELGGANVGVIFAKSIPKTIIFMLAMSVLVLAVFFTAKKGLYLYASETVAMLAEQEEDKGEYEEVVSDSGSSSGSYVTTILEHKLPLITSSGHSGMTPALSQMSSSMLLAEVGSDTSSELNWPKLVRRANSRKVQKVTLASILPTYLCCYFKCCAAPVEGRPHPSASTSSHSRRFHHHALSASESEPSEYAYTENTVTTATGGISPEDELPPMVVPWSTIIVILAVFVLYAVCFVVQKQYSMCELGSYISLGTIYVLLLLQVLWGLRHLVQVRRAKGQGGQLEGEIKWTKGSLIVPAASFLVGVTSALLGIGGGELMGPMMLMLKVLAPVSTASTSFMSLLNTSSSVIHYLVLGELPFGYGAAVFVVGAFGGITGRVLALFFVAKFRRGSLLVFSLVTVLCCSIFIYLAYLIGGKKDFTFSPIC